MKNSLDSKKIYRAFAIISEKGIKQEDGYHYNGLIASDEQDGYTIIIKSSKVTLSLGFHQSYHLDYQNELELSDFTDKLNQIVQTKMVQPKEQN